MYKVIETVIAAGNYKLAELQYKIKKMYLMDDLTEQQLDALLSLAAGSANADAERPAVMDMIHRLSDRVAALEEMLRDQSESEEGEYPAWEIWDGVSDRYQSGAVVMHNGKLWESVYNGQNVWEPGTSGPQFWAEYSI